MAKTKICADITDEYFDVVELEPLDDQPDGLFFDDFGLFVKNVVVNEDKEIDPPESAFEVTHENIINEVFVPNITVNEEAASLTIVSETIVNEELRETVRHGIPKLEDFHEFPELISPDPLSETYRAEEYPVIVKEESVSVEEKPAVGEAEQTDNKEEISIECPKGFLLLSGLMGEEQINDQSKSDCRVTNPEMKSEELKETSPLNIADIKEMLAEIDLLEEKANSKNIVMFSKSGKNAKPKIACAETNQPFSSDDEASNINDLLFEMNFLEGNELLKRGDRAGAINYFREAVNYATKEAHYYLKLAQVLIEDDSTKEEAKQLLAVAIELDPNNMEARSKLFDLQEQPNKAKRLTGAYKRKTGSLQPIIAQNVAQPLNGVSAAESMNSAEKPSEQEKPKTTKTKKTKKTGRLGRSAFATGESPVLTAKISLRNKIIISAFLAVGVLAVIFTWRSEPEQGRIKLLSPSNQSIVSQNRVKLKWEGIADLYIIQIDEKDRRIVERLTTDTQFILPPKDCETLKPGLVYTWRVIPKSINGVELPYKIDEYQFTLVSRP